MLMELQECMSAIKVSFNDNSLLKWTLGGEKVKISAEVDHTLDVVARFAGMVDTDVSPVFLMMYPRAEIRKAAALNYYLKSNGLPSKEDMPYKKMFKIYERSLDLRAVPKVCHCEFLCTLCTKYVRELDSENNSKCCVCSKWGQNIKDMADVAYYCVIDCIRPQQLYVKRAIIAEKRAISNKSYVTLYDGFYRAGGMKARNLLGKECAKNNIAFSNKSKHDSENTRNHFEGGWVFPPKRGLNNRRPVTGIDFNSLYPSLIMTYNLSIDTVVYTASEAAALEAEGYSIYHVKPFNVERGNKKGAAGNQFINVEGWTVRHNNVYSPKQKNIITRYDKYIIYKSKSEEIRYLASSGMNAETLAHYNKLVNLNVPLTRSVVYEPVYGRPALKGERIGIFGYVLKKLFDERVPIKREYMRLHSILELMDAQKLEETIVDGIMTSQSDIEFRYKLLGAKQLAIKILSNTFYGESGNYTSPVYELIVAAGVTSAGRHHIRNMSLFVTSRDYVVDYGDTDSLYIECPEVLFTNADSEYKLSDGSKDAKLKYWTQMVAITMEDIPKLIESISDYLLECTGTRLLNMSYEEVGFPTVLCGKKKYYMTPHTKTINFNPKDVFIKGIDLVKQGQSQTVKDICMEFIRDSLHIDNTLELIDIAVEKVKRFHSTVPDPMLLAQTATYKPDKDNKAVRRFVNRMEARVRQYESDPILQALYEPPAPGDKFLYVVVVCAQDYDLRGCMVKSSKGDKMEYLHVYQASQSWQTPMMLDMRHYLKGALTGILARFIVYHPQFQPPKDKYDITSEDQYKHIDQYCVKKACKYIKEVSDKITGNTKGAAALLGRTYRKVYKEVDQRVDIALYEHYGPSSIVLPVIAESEDVINAISDYAQSLVPDDEDYGRQYIKRLEELGISVFSLNNILNPRRGVKILELRRALDLSAEEAVYNYIRSVAVQLKDLAEKHKSSISTLVHQARKGIVTAVEIDSSSDMHDLLNIIYNKIIKLAAVYYSRKCCDSIRRALITCKPISARPRPDVNPAQLAVDATAALCPVEEYNW
jgi:DNA polymerase elongation subunit (family B)